MKKTNRFTIALIAVLLISGVGCAGEGAGQKAAAPVDTRAPAEQAGKIEAPFRNAVLVGDALTGGQPTRDELAALAEQGYQVVINMRMPGEDVTTIEAAEELGMKYFSLPIDGPAGLTRENAIAFAELLEALDGPAVVHCGSGNRVGAMYALKAFYVDGVSAEEALAVGHEAGLTRLDQSVRQQLGISETSAE